MSKIQSGDYIIIGKRLRYNTWEDANEYKCIEVIPHVRIQERKYINGELVFNDNIITLTEEEITKAYNPSEYLPRFWVVEKY